MVEQAAHTRTIVTLSTGARLGTSAALVLLVVAAYLLWSPIQLYPTAGFPIDCGTAAAPPADALGAAACGEVNVIRQWQVGGLVASAAVIALSSLWAFGVRRREETLIGDERPQSGPQEALIED